MQQMMVVLDVAAAARQGECPRFFTTTKVSNTAVNSLTFGKLGRKSFNARVGRVRIYVQKRKASNKCQMQSVSAA